MTVMPKIGPFLWFIGWLFPHARFPAIDFF